MAKMSKNDVIKDRCCGLRWYDHIVSFVNISELLDAAVKIHALYPTTWGTGWGNLHWAFGNACRKAYQDNKNGMGKIRHNGQTSFNLDECLTKEQLSDFASRCGVTDVYKESWPRD